MASAEDERIRSDSGSDSSLSSVPVILRRQPSSGRQSPVTSATSMDFSFLQLDLLAIESGLLHHVAQVRPEIITTLNLSGNTIKHLPDTLGHFSGLEILDVSQNRISQIDESINNLVELSTFIAADNELHVKSFPKDFGVSLSKLKVLNLGGNKLTSIPGQIYELTGLKSLSLGSNQISEISRDVKKLENLRALYLGGNCLQTIPTEVGSLVHLQSLNLCENKLRTLPSSIANLRNLKSLALHKNLLTALPPEILKLRGLHELSLRNNPLVSRFVNDLTFECPSLLELSGRAIKINKMTYKKTELPRNLIEYLETARRCVNAKCKGVFFDARVEHIKFVDFCGIYRLPLLQYLCSPSCQSTPAHRCSSSDSDESQEVPLNKLRRVLLG